MIWTLEAAYSHSIFPWPPSAFYGIGFEGGGDMEESIKAKDTDRAWEYERALFMLQYHDQMFWPKYSVFLLVSTIILGVIGNIVAQPHGFIEHRPWIIGGAIFGLLICVLWCAVFQHHYAYYRLRILQARRLERNGLPGQLLIDGEKLASGHRLDVDGEHVQMGCLGQKLKFRLSSELLIGLFALIYFLLIVVAACT